MSIPTSPGSTGRLLRLAADTVSKELRRLTDESGQAYPVRIEVWHVKEEHFLDMHLMAFKLADGQQARPVDMGKFSRVAILGYARHPERDALEAAFSETQNLDAPWFPGHRMRSSSVGDVFVAHDPNGLQAYMVASIGFEKVEIAPASAAADGAQDGEAPAPSP